jgi:hypothetical protein
VRRPVWTLDLVRDTNAPLEQVVRVLSEGTAFYLWHPRLKVVEVCVQLRESAYFKANYKSHPFPGVEEQGIFEVWPDGERLLLIHRATFKGWPVLLMMGWWRVRSRRMWECLVESL